MAVNFSKTIVNMKSLDQSIIFLPGRLNSLKMEFVKRKCLNSINFPFLEKYNTKINY